MHENRLFGFFAPSSRTTKLHRGEEHRRQGPQNTPGRGGEGLFPDTAVALSLEHFTGAQSCCVPLEEDCCDISILRPASLILTGSRRYGFFEKKGCVLMC